MGKTPVKIREREYDLGSWSGLKLIIKILFTAVMVVGAVLSVYYGAEAAQYSSINTNAKDIRGLKVQQDAQKEAVGTAFEKFDKVLDVQREAAEKTFNKFDRLLEAQREVLNKTRETLIEQKTLHGVTGKKVDDLGDKVDKLRDEVQRNSHIHP